MVLARSIRSRPPAAAERTVSPTRWAARSPMTCERSSSTSQRNWRARPAIAVASAASPSIRTRRMAPALPSRRKSRARFGESSNCKVTRGGSTAPGLSRPSSRIVKSVIRRSKIWPLEPVAPVKAAVPLGPVGAIRNTAPWYSAKEARADGCCSSKWLIAAATTPAPQGLNGVFIRDSGFQQATIPRCHRGAWPDARAHLDGPAQCLGPRGPDHENELWPCIHRRRSELRRGPFRAS